VVLRAVEGCITALPLQGEVVPQHTTAGVSSFGYSGTIAHAVMRHVVVESGVVTVSQPVVYQRTLVKWESSPTHSFNLSPACSPASFSPINPDTPLMQAGVSSQQAMRFAERVQKLSGATVSATLIYEHPTARAIATHLAAAASVQVRAGGSCDAVALAELAGEFVLSDGRTTLLVEDDTAFVGAGDCMLPLLQEGTLGDRVVVLRSGSQNSTPIVALHMPDGLCSIFLGIAAVLDKPHPLFGIEHGVIRTGNPVYVRDLRMEDIASEYGQLIVHVCNTCTFASLHLIGASFGAALAHITAHAILQTDSIPQALVLIDPIPPSPQLSRPSSTTSSSRLDWRRVAAATLLVRSSIVANNVMEEDQAKRLFSPLQADQIDLVFTQHLVRLGMATASLGTVVASRRRLDAWVHSALASLTYSWGDDSKAEKAFKVTSTVLLVLASDRGRYFLEDASTSDMACYFATNPIVVDGEHLSVLAACTTGQSSRFNSALNATLDRDR